MPHIYNYWLISFWRKKSYFPATGVRVYRIAPVLPSCPSFMTGVTDPVAQNSSHKRLVPICPACRHGPFTPHVPSLPGLPCLHIASPLSPAEQGRGGKLELTGQGGRSSMPFCGPSEPPSGKGTQGSRAGGQAGTQWEAASWGEGWRKRRLKQNSFTDELTFMELPSVSRSGLKLQRRE